MVQDVKIQQLSHFCLDIMYAWVTKFSHPKAFGTDKVVVLAKSIALFVLGHVLAKLVFGNQIAVHQDVQGIVDGGATYSIVFVFHADIERFYIKMAISAIDFLQDSKAFWRLPEFFVL